MAAQPDWPNLPSDLLTIIARRSRDAVTGLTAFRSVCRTWRSAAGPAPRLLLLLPRPRPTRLVFPLARGWSIVFDVRDAACHLSHLATGATAALPRLNASRDAGSDVVRHVRYLDCNDLETAIRSGWIYPTYLDFADCLRFAVHIPPGSGSGSPAGMTIMMYHIMHEETSMLFCRPGDAAWTKVGKPNHTGYGYFDLAYHDGRMFGMRVNGQMAVFDATTLDALQLVQSPPATPNLANKMYGCCCRMEEFSYAHLVALPSKLVLVRTTVKSSRPVAFTIFQLVSAPDGRLAWRMVADAGNYELFVDGYHTTFRENDGANGGGTWIYYVHETQYLAYTAAYRYSVQHKKLECVYKSPKGVSPEFSTKSAWFVP
ncbi:hypothetical protein CFC21_086570 [Triticum aestivum]|uniref:KIB1-4 beta-propeller domain-containing protein n=2 Tax=Triticum aestivum TaxID=4565 RepID=A0A9R1IEK6_WHEAT|nr:hypothetical protein CFC21_086568 [Triticum aestivum]KAF7082709.1 hypothetical protein CFC21_086570 [Triticum aestivum]